MKPTILFSGKHWWVSPTLRLLDEPGRFLGVLFRHRGRHRRLPAQPNVAEPLPNLWQVDESDCRTGPTVANVSQAVAAEPAWVHGRGWGVHGQEWTRVLRSRKASASDEKGTATHLTLRSALGPITK